MAQASGTQRNWGPRWPSGNLLAILLNLIFAGSLFLLSPARAQTGDANEDLAAGPVDEATAARLQAADEERLTALFDQARRKGTVRVIVQAGRWLAIQRRDRSYHGKRRNLHGTDVGSGQDGGRHVQAQTVTVANETFIVNLSAPTTGATLFDARGVGTILNDD